MNNHFKKIINTATGATENFEIEEIQDLWSGYGKILRYGLKGSDVKSVVVKHVSLPKGARHNDLSHKRKLKSYKVEMAWYRQWAGQCNESCRIPECLALEWHGDEFLMVLEDLDGAGFSQRRSHVSWNEMKTCITWLANFHGIFLGHEPENLWKKGTYWHLDTRPDELKVLADLALKKAATAIDQKLQQSRFKTFVHGDAKLANFCFSPDGKTVAAVDFQYVGGGCGMKDLAYFIGSCLTEEECESWETELLDFYFKDLKKALESQQKSTDTDALEQEWRELYSVAWTDFYRFLKGWSPDNYKNFSYSERLACEVVERLKR